MMDSPAAKTNGSNRNSLSDQKCLVMGGGLSGLASVKLLTRLGAKVTISDKKPIAAKDAFWLSSVGADIIDEAQAYSIIERFRLVVVSPGVPFEHPLLRLARSYGLEIIGEIELAFRNQNLDVLAVTGSNGKTTTAALTGYILNRLGVETFVGGNIGCPFAELCVMSIDKKIGDMKAAVLEISSFQLETIAQFHAKAAAFLNLTPDHLDRHGDMQEYLRVKSRIFNRQNQSDLAVINLDDPNVQGLGAPAGRFGFSTKKRPEFGGYVEQGLMKIVDGKSLLGVAAWSDFNLIGVHNQENVMAAVGLCLGLDIDPQRALLAARDFVASDHRLQQVGVYDGVRYIDDSKGTNVGAVARALESFDGPVILIAGGRDKGLDFSYLAPYVSKHVKKLIIMGESRAKIKRSLASVASIAEVSSMSEAVSVAKSEAEIGDVVLLSPACASFDMFKDYKERGDVFASEVRRQAGEEASFKDLK
ncbi:MAG: UDP-N-acetylmuramoyl-L-alanine--D-glutamate ligase [Deltaproteobacteria bacterium]|jgi:UDP-N-acetylmuramoylalanine--D-glutamate ligase|nr:UDP-N-acetylmuramoyl-L-alanine--D-glutamate ligase [Deltaproteobacteria bacterium]